MSRGKQQFIIFLFGILLGAALAIGGSLLYSRLVNDGKIQGASLPVQLPETALKTKVLVSIQRIEKGEELKPEFFQLAERNPDDVPANAIIDEGLIAGRTAAFVIDAREVLTDSKLLSAANKYGADDRLKDYALQGYLVADTVKAGDWIDVEMVRSGGDTSVVLAKKQVMQLKDNKAIIQVSTAERSMINHAIAEQSAGMGHIESVLYLDEGQPASNMTYVPAKITASGTQASSEPAKSIPATANSGASSAGTASVTGSAGSAGMTGAADIARSGISAPSSEISVVAAPVKSDASRSNNQQGRENATGGNNGKQQSSSASANKKTGSTKEQGGKTRP